MSSPWFSETWVTKQMEMDFKHRSNRPSWSIKNYVLANVAELITTHQCSSSFCKNRNFYRLHCRVLLIFFASFFRTAVSENNCERLLLYLPHNIWLSWSIYINILNGKFELCDVSSLSFHCLRNWKQYMFYQFFL